ncbi:MAG: response regulator [Desulfobacteraceae bacterium]|nr:response regulator [Desulfobacteraceae bacterium]
MNFFKKSKEPDEVEAESAEIAELRRAVNDSRMPSAVVKSALREIDRIDKMGTSSAEYTIGINYIDYLVSLPWNHSSPDRLDLEAAKAILDSEHYGLSEVKNRILEHLAVRILLSKRKPRVLVVDDESLTRMNLEHVLVKEGYHVETAENGAIALDLLGHTPFDVIVTDLKMEKVDGMALLSHVKREHPGTEVIFISGYATVPVAIEAIKRGSYHFISKPLKLDELRETVKKALERTRAQYQNAGPVLCFVGPPGTGKTSLGLSIARSLQRRFVRISLAGLKDEAQLRGHRRSYVGALPGRIIQELRGCETDNPVFMLDELDKIHQEFKGDPAGPLLEILDPQQNAYFTDHYLDVPFDLSKIMFITTANGLENIPAPLLDRLEVLWLTGYTEAEKVQIAFNHLIPQEIQSSGLSERPVEFSPEAVRKLIREYTREAGLRGLQRQIASLCRKMARARLNGDDNTAGEAIGPDTVEQFLGPRQFEFEVAQAKDRVGVSTGLAWSDLGGQIVFVEATAMKGRGELILTGSLGTVLKESAQAALSYIRSTAESYGVPEDFFESRDIHVHIPAGAIPKDGASAGLSIAAALLSLVTGRPCRRETAMTGELTLTGRILPVAGIKEKLLAAHRAGVTTVVLPAKNKVDLLGIPDEIQNALDIVYIDELSQAIGRVLKTNHQPIHE